MHSPFSILMDGGGFAEWVSYFFARLFHYGSKANREETLDGQPTVLIRKRILGHTELHQNPTTSILPAPPSKKTNSLSLSSLTQIHPIFHFDSRIKLLEEATLTSAFLQPLDPLKRLRNSTSLDRSVQDAVVVEHVPLLASEL
jgi:hypothetical protein